MPVSQTWVLAVAVVPLLVISVLTYLGHVRRQRGRPTTSGEVVLEYGSVVKALPAILVVLWGVVFIGIAVVEPPQASDALPILGVAAFIAAALVPLTIEVRGVAHRISSQGIQRVSPWSAPLTIPWRDVRSVTYEPLSYWFVVDSPRGKVRLSLLLDGLADFHRAVQAYVPRERQDRASGQAVVRPRASPVARPRHGAHFENRLTGAIVLFVGAAMLAATWYWAVSEGRYPVKTAALGPMAMVLGIGLLIHGNAMARRSVNRLTRIYGVAGTVAGLANLYLLGHVYPIFWITPLVWLLPGWLFGLDAAPLDAAAPPSTAVPTRPTRPR